MLKKEKKQEKDTKKMLKGFVKRMKNEKYKNRVLYGFKYTFPRTIKFKYNPSHQCVEVVKEVKMAIELKKPNSVLSDEERVLLRRIVEDKYSVGAFAGMIFNAHIDKGTPVSQLIKSALKVRLEMESLI